MQRKFVCLAVCAMFASASLFAQCEGARPFTSGPTNPKNGFPLWVEDQNGYALEICLDPALCFFDPVETGNSFSERVGFGAEGFWYLADASLSGRNFKAVLVIGVEAAWLSESPAEGEQFPFSRLRFRIDPPRLGRYTVTHPYGVDVFVVDALEAGKVPRVFVSHDIEFKANATNLGRIGPFLRQTGTLPAGYLGDGTPRPVTGSPCGTNYFQVTAVDLSGRPFDLDGRGNNFVRSNNFVVNARLARRMGAGVPRVSYSRETYDSGVEVFAFTHPPTAARPNDTITMTLDAGPAIALQSDGTGRYYGFIEGVLASPETASITVTNETDNTLAGPDDAVHPESSVAANLVDVVEVDDAYYYRATQTLQVIAGSSDARACPGGGTKLTAYNGNQVLGALQPNAAGALELNLTGITVPPPYVTVRSCYGGQATATVEVGILAAGKNKNK